MPKAYDVDTGLQLALSDMVASFQPVMKRATAMMRHHTENLEGTPDPVTAAIELLMVELGNYSQAVERGHKSLNAMAPLAVKVVTFTWGDDGDFATAVYPSVEAAEAFANETLGTTGLSGSTLAATWEERRSDSYSLEEHALRDPPRESPIRICIRSTVHDNAKRFLTIRNGYVLLQAPTERPDGLGSIATTPMELRIVLEDLQLSPAAALEKVRAALHPNLIADLI